MKRKSLMVWGVMLVYLLMVIVSPLSVSAEEPFEEISEDYSAPIAEEEQDYDEIGEPANTEFEEEWNLMQNDEEAYHELMEEKGYVRRTEEEKMQMIAANPEADIDISQIPDYYIPEQQDEGASTYLLDPDGYVDDFQTLNITGRFRKIAKNENLWTNQNGETNYFGLQGGCFDGTNYYFCFLKKNSSGTHIDSYIVKGTFDNDDKFNIKTKITGLKDTMQHVNDMTYNSDTGELVIVCSQTGYHNIVYTIPKADFVEGATINDFEKHYLSCKINAIDYNATRTRYVARLSGTANGFVILDSDLRVENTFGYSMADEEMWAVQGMCVDNLYIYSLSYRLYSQLKSDGTYKKLNTDEIENRLRIFDWSGNLIKSYELYVDKNLEDSSSVKYQNESENIFIANDRVMLGFACMNTAQNREFSYIDLSPWTYHIQFCPDEDVDKYKGKYNNGNVSAVMFRDVATPLRKSRVSIQGQKFLKWTAYRVEDDTWLYKDPATSTNVWLKASNAGNREKYTYNDKQAVSRTGAPGGHVLMCATWDTSSTFTVSFMKNGGSGTMNDQLVTHGTATALKANAYTKENRNFVGWNAYWSEKNRWYYVSADGTNKGWYKEGYEPEGYKKYTYNNKQSVVQTVHKGNHVYMYALWNEYYIQYDANGAMVPNDMLMKKYAVSSESASTIIFYPTLDYYQSGTKHSTSMTHYTMYRREDGKWRYVDGWYPSKNLAGHSIYKVVGGATAYIGPILQPGEHLVLVAHWDI